MCKKITNKNILNLIIVLLARKSVKSKNHNIYDCVNAGINNEVYSTSSVSELITIAN